MTARERNFVAAYVLYGLVLFVCGALLSGGGDGPAVFWALFGSPLSVVPYVPWAPLVWGIIGRYVASSRQVALTLLLLHYAVAPLAVWTNLSFGSTIGEELSVVRWQFSQAPIFGPLLLLPYVVGQVVTWWLITRKSGLTKTDSTR